MPADQPVAKFVASPDAQLAAVARKDGFRLGRIAGAEDVEDRERAAYERGLAEGRRQATEGSEREWGTRVGDGPVESHASEHSARRWASGDRGVLVEVVSRLDGPWEPAPQGDVPTAPERPAASILAAVGGVADDDAPWPICWAGHLGMLCDRKRDHLGDHVDVYGPLPDHTWTDPLLHTHESGGPYRDCPECIAKAGHIRRHDPGALIEEPDLYEQGDDRG